MDVERYLSGWRDRARRESEEADAAERRARAAVPEVAAILRHHGARAIWLIGSLPRGTFRPQSDLDFLVEGLAEGEVARAAREAVDAVGIEVDVLRMESLDPAWRAYHQRHGERVDD